MANLTKNWSKFIYCIAIYCNRYCNSTVLIADSTSTAIPTAVVLQYIAVGMLGYGGGASYNTIAILQYIVPYHW